MTGIRELIGRLIGEKEKESSFQAQQWMSREAAAIESINKAGTFRCGLIAQIYCKVLSCLHVHVW